MPVGGESEHVRPVVMISKSLVSINISLKYQFRGAVSVRQAFLWIPVMGMHVLLNVFAKYYIISLKVVLSGPTASKSLFYYD